MTPSESSGIHTQLSRSRAQLLCRMQLFHTELCPRILPTSLSHTRTISSRTHFFDTTLPPALSHTHTLCHTRGAGLGLVTWLSMHNSFRHNPFPLDSFTRNSVTHTISFVFPAFPVPLPHLFGTMGRNGHVGLSGRLTGLCREKNQQVNPEALSFKRGQSLMPRSKIRWCMSGKKGLLDPLGFSLQLRSSRN